MPFRPGVWGLSPRVMQHDAGNLYRGGDSGGLAVVPGAQGLFVVLWLWLFRCTYVTYVVPRGKARTEETARPAAFGSSGGGSKGAAQKPHRSPMSSRPHQWHSSRRTDETSW